MKIGIIGLGVVGSACKYGFDKLGHKTFIYDTAVQNSKLEDILDTDICYICVPTPSNFDGGCNTSIVEITISNLQKLNYSGIVAIKSTVKPTTTESISKLVSFKVCFVPEFLRERCAFSDFTENHDLLAIGTDDIDVFNLVKNCHGNFPKQVVKLSPTEAEILKYYSNTFNALKVIFANEIYEICNKVNADYTKIKNSYILRGTTSDSYLDVNDNFRGYGGVCLPKDTRALASFMKELNLDFNLFETFERENTKFKTTVYGNMRLQ